MSIILSSRYITKNNKYINQNKNDKVTLSGISKILIADHSIGKIISIFLDVFLAAYFYKISEQNILYLSLYNIIGWVIATIGAFLVADIIKRKDKVKLYRFGNDGELALEKEYGQVYRITSQKSIK